MKKIISLALAAVIAISANAKKVETTTQHQQTPVFNSVQVDAPVRLVIVPSRRYSVSVNSRESELASAITWNVKDGVLYISTDDLYSLERADETVNVIVHTPRGIDYKIGQDMEEVSSSQRRFFRFGHPHAGRHF